MTMEKEAERLFDSGKKALESGDYDAALKHLSMCLSYSRKPEAYLLKAKAQMKKNDIELAISEAEYGITACGESDSETKSELAKFLESCHSIVLERDHELQKFREEIREVKEGAIKGSAAKAFAQEFKKPSLRLSPVFKNGSRSRMKGDPLVPKDFEWPVRADGTRLTFLVQIDLSIEIVTSQIDYESIRGDADKAKKLSADSRRWRLLLQLDSDDELNFMWGDCGTLYFCIDEHALKKLDFSNVWLELQCY
ncbi:MAG: DUF1963 domain-containing protein [Candidatus Melainabacteria bacterium]|nr:DUF1963 domain-containing protein [Candidatus Melainabacteria bacterium]